MEERKNLLDQMDRFQVTMSWLFRTDARGVISAFHAQNKH
jgi:hypothetical protein